MAEELARLDPDLHDVRALDPHHASVALARLAYARLQRALASVEGDGERKAAGQLALNQRTYLIRCFAGTGFGTGSEKQLGPMQPSVTLTCS